MWKLERALPRRYRAGVKCLLSPAFARMRWVVLLAFSAIQVLAGDTKVIRLRNETIQTERVTHAGVGPQSASETPVSGLYLVQFDGPVQSPWMETLAAAGVTLLRSVPEDAFVASLNLAKLSGLRKLPFIHWVGEYRPVHKVHSALQQAANANADGEPLPVRLLLAPNSNPLEAVLARRMLRPVSRESTSRFGTVLEGRTTGKQLALLARSVAVLWIEPAGKKKLFDEVSSKIVGGGETTHGTRKVTGSLNPRTPGEDIQPGATIHFTLSQALGFDGRGTSVSVADSGLQNGEPDSMHPDLKGRVDAFFSYGQLQNAKDEHGHGTHVAGIVAGDASLGEADKLGSLYGLGVAPKAHVVVQRIFNGTGGFEAPPSYQTLTRDAVRAGAIIGSNSWGEDTQGRYDLDAAEFDALVRDADDQTPGDQPYILEFSAGNAGPGSTTISSPAVAKNVIATGASENNRFEFVTYGDGQEVMADFSSRGPAEDGRIKPDLVAPGTWIASLQSSAASAQNAWAPISANYQYQGGTSQAGPHVSGAAAVFAQFFRETHTNSTPSPALVKAALINSAVDLNRSAGGGDTTPNMDEGWGRVDLTQLTGSRRRYEFIDQTQLLSSGEQFEHRFVVSSAGEPLKVTMTYTDVPGLPAAIPSLVNNLDLEVIAPDGMVYHGNQFQDGESVAGAPSFDSVNNVEGVHLILPVPGEYVVRVRARSVAEDARRDTAKVDQDFALVISGDLPLPGMGVVIMDRSTYGTSSIIHLKVIDLDQAGRPSAQVLLKSNTEQNGELLSLQPFGANGVFTGAVTTVTGPAATDGRLQITHGDEIQAVYQDGNQVRTTRAQADLLPPQITSVTATNTFGRAVIMWATDEPSDSLVRYDKSDDLKLSATYAGFRKEHRIVLENLEAGTTYRFLISSTDQAGNNSISNNDGKFFTFTPIAAETVLLIDAYHPANPVFGGTDVPLTAYTDALDRTGVSYEVWNLDKRGSPGTNDLRPYRVVMWRLNDSFVRADDTLSPQQQTVLQSYVNSGGALFISSMELLTRLGENSAFRTNILHVESFNTDAGVAEARGPASDPVTGGMSVTPDYSLYNSDVLDLLGLGSDWSDTLSITTNAAPILFDTTSGNIAGLRYPRTGQDSSGRVVFLGFPLDAIPEDTPPPNNRANLLRNILAFLAPGIGGVGSVALDSSEFTIPSLVTIEVADSDLSGSRTVQTTLSSQSAPGGVPITLSETVQRGLFRGFVTLVNQTNAPAAAQLRVASGDTVRAEYFDVSANIIVQATAYVDTRAPKISQLRLDPEYEEAAISWITTEASDSLVQFGESTFLGRTAYNSEPALEHSVRLVGLMPERIYYYQVVSRDAAGNTSVDNNSGKLHTFRTLKPWPVPFNDHFDQPGNDWLVRKSDIDEFTEPADVQWRVGTPANGRESRSPSSPNAWGSNLDGGAVDLANTDLVSPPVELQGGNKATLRFVHSYDFSPRADFLDIETGRLFISTDNGTSWTTLKEYEGVSAGWEQQEIDLSPYLGRVVRIGWNYELFAFEAVRRPGWLIDDVSITVTNVLRGTIQITNNLSQSGFTLNGPAFKEGQGFGLLLTNAPVGEYVIGFKGVPYYLKPPSQTNTLTANTTLLFEGNYTFPDENQNGISDLWEQGFFEEVSPKRHRDTDSDGDGASDYAEFAAGTDPTRPDSLLELESIVPLPTGGLRLGWRSVAGRSYRVLGSVDAVRWSPYSEWIRAVNADLSFNIPPMNPAIPHFFKLELRP